ncbi:MAG: hypothetical protein GMKNLPBB_01819 [Myxococcota bacterium]|nr:hypothetical protein [Myxococcota bacterium]
MIMNVTHFVRVIVLAAATSLASCGSAGSGDAGTAVFFPDAAADAGSPCVNCDASSSATGPAPVQPRELVVVTFNTGTSEGQPHDAPPDDGYGSAQAKISDQHYGDGLAWKPVVEDARRFFSQLNPDIVVFQEIFYPGLCPDIPPEFHPGWVCEGWKPGDPPVAQMILGPGWQVVCHPGKPDKCAAVKFSVGKFRGCDKPFCVEGMEGVTVNGCGKGARVARAAIDLAGGGEINLVNFHGSSGFDPESNDCRRKQVDQVFVDMGAGAPAVRGSKNLIMGDLNTDPGRLTGSDPSAARWREFAGPGKRFRFISPMGQNVTPTYAGLFNIDHVLSDHFTGECVVPGVTGGYDAVSKVVYFDHKPVVCRIR